MNKPPFKLIDNHCFCPGSIFWKVTPHLGRSTTITRQLKANWFLPNIKSFQARQEKEASCDRNNQPTQQPRFAKLQKIRRRQASPLNKSAWIFVSFRESSECISNKLFSSVRVILWQNSWWKSKQILIGQLFMKLGWKILWVGWRKLPSVLLSMFIQDSLYVRQAKPYHDVPHLLTAIPFGK